jgi:predicted nucleotidyltransferase
MTTKAAFLTNTARDVVAQLSQHAVLSRYWDGISVILKGSTARDNADRYSDIDLVMYGDERNISGWTNTPCTPMPQR